MSQAQKMTIAKALRYAKGLRGRLAVLTARVQTTLNWESGKTPTFKFEKVIAERDKTANELTRLKAAIAVSNVTNNDCFEDNDMPVQQAIFLMAELKGQKALYESFTPRWEKTIEHQRVVIKDGERKGELGYKEVEHVFVSALTEEKHLKKVDKLQERIDALNDVLEFHNHGTTITLNTE